MADVDILRYVITGDTKGLKAAVQEADQVTATATRNIIRNTSGVDAGFSKAFSVKHRSLVDGINSSIISMAGSMIPLSGNTRLAALALSQVSGILFSLGGPATVALVALGGLAAAFALTRDKSEEFGKEVQKNADTLFELARAGDAFAAQLLAREFERLSEELKKLRDEQEKASAVKPIQEAAAAWAAFGKQAKLDELENKIAQITQQMERFKRGFLPTFFPAEGGSSAAAHQELVAAQRKLAEESAKVWNEAFAAFWENFKNELARASAQATARARSNLTALTVSLSRTAKQSSKDTIENWLDGLRNITDGVHRLAFEFTSRMDEAVARFVHNAIEGVSEITAGLKAASAGQLTTGGAFGLAGAALGLIGGIADLFSGGAKTIEKSNLEVVQAIREWISNLRGGTRREIGAQILDINKIVKLFNDLPNYIIDPDKFGVAFDQSTVDLLSKNIEKYLGAGTAEQFRAAVELFKTANQGQFPSANELFAFWGKLLEDQKGIFAAQLEAIKNPKDVIKWLKKETELDFSRGSEFIRFFTNQNKFTPAEQEEIWMAFLGQLQESGNITESELLAIYEELRRLREESGNISEDSGQQIQITRSVASITEGQANLVVGHLSTINAVIQSIYELMQGALDNFTAAAGGIPSPGGGVTFGPGAIVVNGGANATAREIVDVLTVDLRAKGVKI